MRTYRFTTESVTEGHPDKVADRISDSILDESLKQDPFSRVAVETITYSGGVFVTGQITTSASLEVEAIVRDAIRDIGYSEEWGYDPASIEVLSKIDRQSPDIAMGVNGGVSFESGRPSLDDDEYWARIGAGDQGIMFGFAVDETKELMPLTISMAHQLAYRLAQVRKNGTVDFLGPDGKTQVTLIYEGDKVKAVESIVVSVQHKPTHTVEQVREAVIETVIKPILAQYIEEGALPHDTLNSNIRYYVNPTGRFVIGGPVADTGLTGRKVIVDSYGGAAHNGGGCFSGKDATKVDRSGAYAARYIAKNIVAAGLARKCEVQLSYVIGVPHPVSLYINTFGTGVLPEEYLEKVISEMVDLRPGMIIKKFRLYEPIYSKLSAYGHFGRRDLSLPWESLDLVEQLRELKAALIS